MDRFIHEENLRHYRRLLERTTDPGERARILTLLAEEQARTDGQSAPGPHAWSPKRPLGRLKDQ